MVNSSSSPTQQPSTTESSQAQASSSQQVNHDNRARHIPRQAIATSPTKLLSALSIKPDSTSNTNINPQQDRLLNKFAQNDPFLITKNTNEKEYIEKLGTLENIAKHKNFCGQTLLNQAIISNKNQIVNFLLELEKFDLDQESLRFTPLMAAAHVNNKQACKQLIEAGATIDMIISTKSNSYTAITKALLNEDKTNDLANYLISMLPVNEKHNVVNQELRISAALGELDIVKFLLNKHKADLFSQNATYSVAMSNASAYEQHEVVEFLLEQTIQQLNEIDTNEGAEEKNKKAADIAFALICNGSLKDLITFMEKVQLNVNQKDSDGESLLYLAAGWNKLKIVKYLVEEKKATLTLRSNGESASAFAAEEGCSEMMHYLLSQMSFPEVPGQAHECFVKAAYQGRKEILTEILARYPVPINQTNYKNLTALHLASGNNQFDTVKFLVENIGANVRVFSGNNQLPLEHAAKSGNIEITEYLIKSTPELYREEDLVKAFIRSAQRGNVETVKFLYEKYREIVDGSNDNPVKDALFLACDRGQLEMIEYFVSKNADISQEFNNKDLITNAACQGQDDIVKYLLTQYGGEERKEKALELAFEIESNNNTVTPLFKYLVTNEGINLNGKQRGLTLFDKAVKHGRMDYIHFLIENGSKITLKRLRKCGNTEVFKFILKNIPPEDVKKIGKPTALSKEVTEQQVLTWMILRAGANNKPTDRNSMYESIHYKANDESDSDSDSAYSYDNTQIPAALIAGRSQLLLENLEEAIISGDSNLFHFVLNQIEKSDYSQEVLNLFGYHSLNRAAYMSLTRIFVKEDIVVNLIAMGANPKEILETENELVLNTKEEISETARQFLIEVGDRSQYENSALLVKKVQASYQSHLANLNPKRPAELMSTISPAKKARLSEKD